MSFGFIDQLSSVLELLNHSKNYPIDRWWARAWGRFWRSYNFRIDNIEELFLSLLSILIGIVIFYTDLEHWKGPWFGFMSARVVSYISIMFKDIKKNRL
ncbi:MAG: hypothetical protein GYB35_16305 [Algicola sp.]|nr:hypothetical protein [Algicola sp.]